jgi:DNA topoisomerase-1
MSTRQPRTPATAEARRDARATGLRYVSPDEPGIRRRRAGRGFTYADPRGRAVRGERTLARIRSIAIPPAWTDVWICPSPRGHLQATGRDARGRRQYRYHPRFRARRDADKFARLVLLGERLPRIRRRVREDLAAAGLPREKVLAAVIRLLDSTGLRIGNDEYARLNRSFGVSTLRGRHASVIGANLRFRFRGKGGRVEERTVVDRRLATVVRRCQDLPGQALFQYLAEDGEVHPVSSEDVNDYLRVAAGTEELSGKDLRTWAATKLAFRALRDSASTGDRANADADAARRTSGARRRRRNPVIEALRRTAEELGNSLAVTRGSYVHPGVVAAFEDGDEANPIGSPPHRPPPRRRGAAIDRREELALLALLRSVERPARTPRRGGAARRSQVDAPRVASRRRGRAA